MRSFVGQQAFFAQNAEKLRNILFRLHFRNIGEFGENRMDCVRFRSAGGENLPDGDACGIQ